MKKRNLILLIIGILIILLLVLGLIFTTSFQVSTMNSEGEILVCKSCICFGLLKISESYPPQYNCIGLKTCQDTGEC